MSSEKIRLDRLLVERGLAGSRERARALILAGQVLVNEQRIDKAGSQVAVDVELRLKREDIPYVSRGGLKLEAALKQFPVRIGGRVAIDVGASTGGFTDCLLQHGAARVYAVDVGYGQLAWSLRNDTRVINLERTNIRHLTADRLDPLPDLAVIDASFISLAKVLPPTLALLQPEADIIALVKPQFEVGRGKVGKGGVVRDPALRRKALQDVADAARELGLTVGQSIESPVPGPKGNREFLLHLFKRGGV
ncbi:23S rRNA (cytidine1920-2'-O)/16S rRNA (cytidine1409-2'-O)-methyltransferase [Geothermobacter ehrlichii]|uniref:23S rRNA (Cytidine1920-2'-O)/16S rRNA (Cytidine1409-2'-O)-methyltransferase n=1 Tax=Geothermobacter ehrlichii TaxID=213224 RepID=A0A5D3WNT1_9BACT|nr:TlyA family RNA methyltransferase [Geothermobacter ehrlichii]TYP00232.1 23S rRNA (cytidine1920-2'-O)/16S rRNA (cytidine1409-2'-O)-methyltransferase [Geothermobacter ehrlichii]